MRKLILQVQKATLAAWWGQVRFSQWQIMHQSSFFYVYSREWKRNENLFQSTQLFLCDSKCCINTVGWGGDCFLLLLLFVFLFGVCLFFRPLQYYEMQDKLEKENITLQIHSLLDHQVWTLHVLPQIKRERSCCYRGWKWLDNAFHNNANGYFLSLIIFFSLPVISVGRCGFAILYNCIC